MNARDDTIASSQQAPERHQPKLYHDLLTPAETLAIRQEVRRFSDEHVAPVAWEIGHREESVENFPRELFRKMADAGLFRIPFAAEVGGRGLKYPACATAALIEELAYHSNSVAAVVDVHCILAGHALEHASPQLQARYLTPLLAGEKIGSFATRGLLVFGAITDGCEPQQPCGVAIAMSLILLNFLFALEFVFCGVVARSISAHGARYRCSL
ncbi:acyl-CoA dehydrogenase family protein [Variovorax robiniae]|uniref:Acyl-CoA dehydrogenase family protein n=1 Tax=Variovorax robiniae TaxID=1836199 RepID=A0ABU8XHS3_9BURK